jgi:hypothetical protein
MLFGYVNISNSQQKYVVREAGNVIELSEGYAISQVGKVEQGNNRGSHIRAYLKLFGLPEGNPYCAAGQYWCYYEASKELKLSLNELPRTALAYNVYRAAVRRGRAYAYVADRHDFIIWKSPHNTSGHIERVIRADSKGWVLTIGFNSGNSGREGIWLKRRNIYHPLQHLRILGLVGVQPNE